jgi:hypothetical protein
MSCRGSWHQVCRRLRRCALRRIWAIAVIAVFPVLEVEHCGRREPADGASC